MPDSLDSRLRGNDGRAVSVFSNKFLKLKISSFLQKQKTKNRNLKSRHSHESGNPGRGISRNRLPGKFARRQARGLGRHCCCGFGRGFIRRRFWGSGC
ncbi:hypothetical protein EUA31_08740 [Neisseria meningitidis]|nr:hypothetical protein EUA31_08740 [Neisseria meningitidis]